MIKEVICYVGPNQISEGFYTLDAGQITMVHPDGKPVNLDGGLVQHTMREGDNEEAIAKVLTRRIRKHFRGEIVEGFSNPINYPTIGIA